MVKYWKISLLACLIVFLTTEETRADILSKCITLMSATGQTASTNGSIMELPDTDPNAKNAVAFMGLSTAVHNSGSATTLDVKIQTCTSASSATCSDTPIVFDQCGVSTCYTTGSQRIDLNKTSVNLQPFFRAVTTAGGASPNYDVTVKLCYH
jgi:hypothetical protein